MKLVSQPSTAGDFIKPTGGLTTREMNQYTLSTGVTNNSGTIVTFTVPAGMNFILNGMASFNSTNTVGYWLGSLVIDGATIYPMLGTAGVGYVSLTDSRMWPWPQKIDDYVGFSTQDSILIESELRVNCRPLTANAGKLSLFGFFVEA